MFVGLFFILGISYGLIIQREKVTGTLVSIYIASVASQIASPYVQQFFSGDSPVGSIYIDANPAPFLVKTIVFIGVILLLTTRGGLTGIRSKGLLSPVEVGLYAALNSAIVLSTILHFLDEGIRANLSNGSTLAKIVIQYHDVWLIAPIIVLIVMGVRHRSRYE